MSGAGAWKCAEGFDSYVKEIYGIVVAAVPLITFFRIDGVIAVLEFVGTTHISHTIPKICSSHAACLWISAFWASREGGLFVFEKFDVAAIGNRSGAELQRLRSFLENRIDVVWFGWSRMVEEVR